MPRAYHAQAAATANGARPHFNSLLQSKPLLLGAIGYPGDTGRLAVVYDLARVMALPEERETVFAADVAHAQRIAQLMQDAATGVFEEYRDVLVADENALTAARERAARAVALLQAVPPDGDDSDVEDVIRQARLELDNDAPPLDPARRAAAEAAFAAVAAANAARKAEMLAAMRAITHAIIARCVIALGVPETTGDPRTGRDETRLIWPYAEPAPDPADPASYDAREGGVLDGHVVDWLATSGIERVRDEMRGPLFGGESRPTGMTGSIPPRA